jgi:hypothetical protein
MFTTIYHHAAPQNPQKPLQNSHSTMPKLIAAKPAKNTRDLARHSKKKTAGPFRRMIQPST